MWLRHWWGGDRPARRARVIVLHKNMPEWEWWWLRLDGVVPPQVLNCCDCDGECPGPGLEFLSRRAAGSTGAVAPSTNLGWSRFFSGSWDDHAFHDLNFKKLVSHPKFQIGLCKKIVGLFKSMVCSVQKIRWSVKMSDTRRHVYTITAACQMSERCKWKSEGKPDARCRSR